LVAWTFRMPEKVKLRNPLQTQALQELLLVCELRGLEDTANKEIQAMNFDLQIDIDKWPFLRRAFDTATHEALWPSSGIRHQTGGYTFRCPGQEAGPRHPRRQEPQ